MFSGSQESWDAGSEDKDRVVIDDRVEGTPAYLPPEVLKVL
jgi:hypothetical protein